MTAHMTLTAERWSTFSFASQIMNISSELSRAVSFKKKHDVEHMNASLWRALELTDLSLMVSATTGRRREMARFREALSGIIVGADSETGLSLSDLQAGIEPFALICARERGV